jgi:hypothetical protein
VVALSILHLHYVKIYADSSNPGIALELVIVVQQVQLCWSLISATIPNLKTFVKSFSSGFGIQLDPALTTAYGSERRGTNGYELGSVGTKRSGNQSKPSSRLQGSNHAEEPVPASFIAASSTSKITSPREHSMDSGGSQDHIIRKDVDWRVHYETNHAM